MLLNLDDIIVTDDAVSEETWRTVWQRLQPYVGERSSAELYGVIKTPQCITGANLVLIVRAVAI